MKKWSTKEPKFWKLMKLCAIQSLLAMTLFGASIAHDGSGQALEQKITINVKDETLLSVLQKIELEADVRFVYNTKTIDLQQKVSLVADNKPLKELIDELLTSRAIEYRVHDKERAITLRKAQRRTGNASEEQNSEPSLNYSPVQIAGTVTGGSPPEPLAGVNVLIKGTTVGTTSDAAGKYTILASEGDVLVFSFIGFQSQEVTVASQSVIDIHMLEDSRKLNEVVINAGYWQVDSKENTGNISRVTSSQLETQTLANPMHALQ
ncbi:MAG TPA: carboxypeptidase-like regulatory domain-containing protein, partial [Cyclobacteriaceae bacterium]|nr:carboxypeptidase-like regulatory domain-containing protein [Cyclobacteriaceae bacterium]